jgi:hypothetical protein
MSSTSTSNTMPPVDLAGQLLDQQFRTAAIEVELAQLRSQVRSLQNEPEPAASPVTAEQLAEVARMTTQMFGVEPTFEFLVDPSEPDQPILLFTVRASGTAEEHIQQELAWHQRIREQLPSGSDILGADMPRLRIVPA